MESGLSFVVSIRKRGSRPTNEVNCQSTRKDANDPRFQSDLDIRRPDGFCQYLQQSERVFGPNNRGVNPQNSKSRTLLTRPEGPSVQHISQ
jgi:hypothetical protein